MIQSCEYLNSGGFSTIRTNHDRGGVPHVILPQWADLYDFASLVENLKIGVWGCRATSPSWTTECIQEAILLVLKDSLLKNSSDSSCMARNAATFGDLARKTVGRDVAAKEVARLAASGHV